MFPPKENQLQLVYNSTLSLSPHSFKGSRDQGLNARKGRWVINQWVWILFCETVYEYSKNNSACTFQILNEISLFFFAIYCLFLEMLRIDIMILIWIFHSLFRYCFNLFILFMCTLFSLLDRFCSFLSLFESSFILSTHTLQCKRWLISNQSMHLAALYMLYIKQSLYKNVCMYNNYIYALLYSRATPTRDTPDRDRLPHYGPRFSPR